MRRKQPKRVADFWAGVHVLASGWRRPPTVTISRHYDFEASHYLPHVADDHKCRRMHGHSYRLTLSITGPVQEQGEETGMVVDFDVPDRAWAMLKAHIDHTCLNDTVDANPTVEVMTPILEEVFRFYLATQARKRSVAWTVRVTLHEGPRTSCST